MSTSEYDRLCTVFMKTFASVPDPLRNEIILVIEGKPYTWETVFIEVKARTRLSKMMLEQLKNLKIIE